LDRATQKDLDAITRALADFAAKPASGANAILPPSAVETNTSVIESNDLTKSRLEATKAKVPVLGDIPLVGKLFRSDTNSPPEKVPQILVSARFLELPQEDGFDWYFGSLFTNLALPRLSVSQFHGILTDPQFRVVLRALEQRNGVDLLAGPQVMTVSGRQAQIQSVDVKTIVTGITSTNGSTNALYQTQTMPFGPVLDVIPYLGADGYTINMTVIPTVTEFLGYDNPAIYGLTNFLDQTV